MVGLERGLRKLPGLPSTLFEAETDAQLLPLLLNIPWRENNAE
jgi:hypothetical protein